MKNNNFDDLKDNLILFGCILASFGILLLASL